MEIELLILYFLSVYSASAFLYFYQESFMPAVRVTGRSNGVRSVVGAGFHPVTVPVSIQLPDCS